MIVVILGKEEAVSWVNLNLESLIRDTDNKDKGIVAVSYAGA